MLIQRNDYLQKLISHKHNGLVKIITGIRRCGKSYLLNIIFKNYLIENNVKEDHIIQIAFDDRRNKELRDPDKLLEYVYSKIVDTDMYYLLADEIQMVPEFEDVLNSFLHTNNLDVYVTGSNSKFLSSDIITEFRGRSDQIKLHPLSFLEYYNASDNANFDEILDQYFTFGGMPFLFKLDTIEEKQNYLITLYHETYIRDIVERNHLQKEDTLESVLKIISSSIGSLVNPLKLSKAFKSININVSDPTIKQYIDYCIDAFLINKSYRYDIKGKKYISTPYKLYFEDIGLRNALLGFRQIEETHIMENIIYNELISRGYLVDVGVVEINEPNENGNYVRKNIEVDFVVNQGNKRYYIQSAYNLPTVEKKEQEKRPLLNVNDTFKKIIIVRNNLLIQRDEFGIVTMGLREFLLNPNSLDL